MRIGSPGVLRRDPTHRGTETAVFIQFLLSPHVAASVHGNAHVDAVTNGTVHVAAPANGNADVGADQARRDDRSDADQGGLRE